MITRDKPALKSILKVDDRNRKQGDRESIEEEKVRVFSRTAILTF